MSAGSETFCLIKTCATSSERSLILLTQYFCGYYFIVRRVCFIHMRAMLSSLHLVMRCVWFLVGHVESSYKYLHSTSVRGST